MSVVSFSGSNRGSNVCDRCVRMNLNRLLVHPNNGRGPCPLPSIRDDPDGSLTRQGLQHFLSQAQVNLAGPSPFGPAPPYSLGPFAPSTVGPSASLAPAHNPLERFMSQLNPSSTSTPRLPTVNQLRGLPDYVGLSDAEIQSEIDAAAQTQRAASLAAHAERLARLGSNVNPLAPAANPQPALPAPGAHLFGPAAGAPGQIAPPPPPRTTIGLTLGNVIITTRRTAAIARPLHIEVTPANLTHLLRSRGLGAYLGLDHIAVRTNQIANIANCTGTILINVHNATHPVAADAGAVRALPGRTEEANINLAGAVAFEPTIRFQPPSPVADSLWISVYVELRGRGAVLTPAPAEDALDLIFTVGAITN